MRSAYLVLGVAGDATPEEIDAAFRKAERGFTPERIAAEERALARLAEIKTAYQLLRDPASRAAHDRKLREGDRPAAGAASRPSTSAASRARQVEDETPAMRRFARAATVFAVVIAAASTAVHYRNEQARREVAAQEAAARLAAQQQAERDRLEAQRQAAAREEANRVAEAADRRFAAESQASAARANAAAAAQEANFAAARRAEVYEQQRREAARAAEDNRAAYEARLRTERDKQRIRELCYQNYRRPDC